MTSYINIIFASFCLLVCSLEALPTPTESSRIIVNNRILARVNGKLISTHDVMKKMDIIFLKQFSEYTSSPTARYKFYQANWQSVLDELINKELILADAEESKVVVSNGDIRQEMESMFGPNIIENLDKIGMSFDEATEILKGELIIKRMIAQNVHSRSIRIATPNKTRAAYDEFIRKPENIRPTEWRFKVLTIQDRNTEKAETLANTAYNLLTVESIRPDEVIETLKTRQLVGRRTKISLSNEIVSNSNDLQESYKQALDSMEAGMISLPSFQKNRAGNSSSYRIFYVIDRVEGGTIPFKQIEGELKDQVLSDIINTETDLYLERLRKHFHLQDNNLVSQDFQPFILK